MNRKIISRREFLGVGALAASGSLSGCTNVLSTDETPPGGEADVSDLVTTRPAEGLNISVRSAIWDFDPVLGHGVAVDSAVNARISGEYWVRMAVVWDGATQASDTETTEIIEGETAAVNLYYGSVPHMDEIEEIIVGAAPTSPDGSPDDGSIVPMGEDR